MAERVEPCPYCVRGQVANPEIYPPGVFARVREITRTVIDMVAERGGEGPFSRDVPMLVVCPKCEGKRELPVVEAAHELLVSHDESDA